MDCAISVPSRQVRRRAFVSVLAATTGLTVRSVIVPAPTAEAATVTTPTEVWTAPGEALAFAGIDPITSASRDVAIAFDGDDTSCQLTQPGGEGYAGDCALVQITLYAVGLGTMSIDDHAVGYDGAGRSGSEKFQIVGTAAAVNAALATLVYTPPDAVFETPPGDPLQASILGFDPGGGAAGRSISIHVRSEPTTSSWWASMPRHVYTTQGTPLAFTGVDAVSGDDRALVVDAPVDTSGCSYDPAVSQWPTGSCLIARLRNSGAGRLAVGAGPFGVKYIEIDAASGGFQVTGPEAEVQKVLATLTWIPPDDAFVTPDGSPVAITIQLTETETYETVDDVLYVHVLPAPPVDCPDETSTTTGSSTTIAEPQDAPTTVLLGPPTTSSPTDSSTSTSTTTTSLPLGVEPTLPSISFVSIPLPPIGTTTSTSIPVPALRRSAAPPAVPDDCPDDSTPDPGDDTVPDPGDTVPDPGDDGTPGDGGGGTLPATR